MIIENGILQMVERTGGGTKNGNPVKVTEMLGNPIHCNIKTNTNDHNGKVVDGVFTRASFEVLVDSSDIHHFTAEYVELTDNRGQRIGRFRVQDIQHLDCVGAVKITV